MTGEATEGYTRAGVEFSPSSTMHGAALVSEHIFPLSVIEPVQQSYPFLLPHPEPPQYPQPTCGDAGPGKGRESVGWGVYISNGFDAGEALGAYNTPRHTVEFSRTRDIASYLAADAALFEPGQAVAADVAGVRRRNGRNGRNGGNGGNGRDLDTWNRRITHRGKGQAAYVDTRTDY